MSMGKQIHFQKVTLMFTQAMYLAGENTGFYIAVRKIE